MNTTTDIHITATNFYDFKPSEFMDSMVDTISRFETERNIGLNMSRWMMYTSRSRRMCCPGGIAILSLMEKFPTYDLEYQTQFEKLKASFNVNSVMVLFDEIRLGNKISHHIMALYNNYYKGIDFSLIDDYVSTRPTFHGTLNRYERLELLERISVIGQMLNDLGI